MLLRDASLLSRIRWLFVLLSVVVAVLAPLDITYDGTLGGQRVAVFMLASVALGAWAVAYFRVGSTARWLELLPFPLILAATASCSSTGWITA